MKKENSLDDAVEKHSGPKLAGKVVLCGLLAWNVIIAAAGPLITDGKKLNFREMNQKYYETMVKDDWTKVIMYPMYGTTLPGRIAYYGASRLFE